MMKGLNRARKGGFFAPGDLAVYAILLALVVILLCVTLLDGRGEKPRGIRIVVNEENAYTYVFGSGGKAGDNWESRIETTEDETAVHVKIYLDEDKREYNEVLLDKVRRTAKMKDANCSFRKDCTAMQEVSSESGVIVCLPHRVKVLALSSDEDYFHPSLG